MGAQVEYQNTYETTISKALKAAGVPTRYLGAEPRPDLLNGAYLYGKTGRGKTHAACGAVRAFVERHVIEVEGEYLYHGPRARFVNVPVWFSEIRSTYDRKGESEREVFDRYARCSLLVLDDLGKGSKTEWAVERLYMLLDHRCNECLPTIITSNYGLAKLASMLTSDEDTIQAIASRALLTCDGNGIEVTGSDRRRKNKDSRSRSVDSVL